MQWATIGALDTGNGEKLPMPDLARIMLTLRPTHQDTVPAWTGRAAHAWFLQALQHINPALSERLHDMQGVKPMTFSGLQPAPDGELLTLHPARPLWLRITTLHPDLTNITLNGLAPQWEGAAITLHDQPLQVESMALETATYSDLVEAFRHKKLRRYIRFKFITPTFFKSRGLQIPLPSPELVFGSLLQRWQTFSTVGIGIDDFKDFMHQKITIDQHNIHTRKISFARGQRGYTRGFVGEVTFFSQAKEQAYLAAWHTLAAFGAYSSVGAQTSYGLGQIEVI